MHFLKRLCNMGLTMNDAKVAFCHDRSPKVHFMQMSLQLLAVQNGVTVSKSRLKQDRPEPPCFLE